MTFGILSAVVVFIFSPFLSLILALIVIPIGLFYVYIFIPVHLILTNTRGVPTLNTEALVWIRDQYLIYLLIVYDIILFVYNYSKFLLYICSLIIYIHVLLILFFSVQIVISYYSFYCIIIIINFMMNRKQYHVCYIH